MATLGSYFFNSNSFATATALFTDSALTQCAPDGFYSDNIIVREQKNCLLQVAQNCDCSTPTPTPTATPTPTPTVTPTPTASPQPTNQPTPTATDQPTPTPSPTPSATAPPPPIVSGKYYQLDPCPGSSTSDSCYIFSKSSLAPGARYLNPNTQDYYTYNSSATAKSNVNQGLVCTANMELVPNVAGCPPQQIQPVTNYYVVRDCNTNEDSVFATTNTYSLNVRLIDGSGNTYTVQNQVSSTTGYTQLTGLVCVDANGTQEGQSGFTTCAFNCPSDEHFLLTRCRGYGGTELSKEKAITLQQRGFQLQDVVYSADTETCYTISGVITSDAANIGQPGTPGGFVDALVRTLTSCSQCTNASSDNSSSSGSISSQSPPPPTGF